jgi:hypothetical protein
MDTVRVRNMFLPEQRKLRQWKRRRINLRHSGVRHFLAAYDLETGRLFDRFTARKAWRDFLSFLHWLRRR